MRAPAPQWTAMIGAFVDDPDSIAVAGEDAGALARELSLGFGLALTVEESQFALLGLEAQATRVRELPGGSVDVVVFRRAWSGPVEADRAMSAAKSTLRPGGRVFAGERELDRLSRGSLVAYPIRALTTDDMTAGSVGRLGLAASLVRAGLRAGEVLDIDEHRGMHDGVAAFAAALADEIPEDRFEELDAAYRRRTVEDVEPWVYVTGVRL